MQNQFSSVQFSSVAQLCPTLCDSMDRGTPGLPVHHQLPEFTQTHAHRVGDANSSSHLILCHPLLLLPPIPPSIRVFSSESTLRMRWPNYWSFSFSISPILRNTQDWSPLGWTGWISGGTDIWIWWESLKNLLKYHTSKASILRRSAFFIVQLSHPYMTTGKTITLTRQTLSAK